jgi:hypothetical protein
MHNEFKDHTREEYKQRHNFTDTDYYKIVSFSVKLYKQCAETGKDVFGNDLTEEEIKISKGLITRMSGDLKMYEEQFNKDRNE